MNLNNLNYYTVYSFDLNNGAHKRSFESGVCFGDLFRNLNETSDITFKLNFKIRVFFDKCQLKLNLSNNCYLTEEELKWYFNEINKILPFEYTISEKCKQDSEIYRDFEFILFGNSKQLRWFATVIRYIYELPYSLHLKQAVYFKMNKKFVNINVLNLFNIIASSSNLENGTIHCIGYCDCKFHKFISYDKLKEILSNYDNFEVNYDKIYPYIISKNGSYEMDISDDDFIDNDIFKYFKHYKANYLLIKEKPNYILK